MKKLFMSLALALTLTGCADAQNAATESVRLQAQAQIETARAIADAQKAAAVQATVRAGIWAAAIPVMLLIIGAAVLACMGLVWFARIYKRRMELVAEMRQLPAPALRPTLPSLRRMKLLAEEQGYELVIEGDAAYLVDSRGQRRYQRLLTGG